ncbi:protein-L-isoaspartate(D-aspartate) O-methyltransferase [Prolixibacter denitrificans]|jgi:protein-L-isoaspartate(D-aspartate) O-methyltransferase|uniref:Protein-L-isoaspartate O-methyltransferase n=2 Tax=Prolixibacter denitrificans TaxID=1541063 RepID=A0A2P8C6P1_9BACT|nr:protein-L-isoaspartate(D-aspartate) O-methyltransferase [Prolixibacter denitrificans]PSK80643.1 protein-L-isoaspartate(D-aspartate) O-methyltransferase [Prolixibacter denitrificans]
MKLIAILLLIFIFPLMACAQEDFEAKRMEMVKKQIIARGINDGPTIRAMRKVPRQDFVPDAYRDQAYRDSPLSIGYGQTISQPYIVALMTEKTKPSKGKRALEIGTGSGYQAAVLAEIVDSVYTIELIPGLARHAAKVLAEHHYDNVVPKQGDGYRGWPEHAPFDIILVTAAGDHVPRPLIDQLAENGRLIMPVGQPGSFQQLVLLIKRNGRIKRKNLATVQFVPLQRE